MNELFRRAIKNHRFEKTVGAVIGADYFHFAFFATVKYIKHAIKHSILPYL